MKPSAALVPQAHRRPCTFELNAEAIVVNRASPHGPNVFNFASGVTKLSNALYVLNNLDSSEFAIST